MRLAQVGARVSSAQRQTLEEAVTKGVVTAELKITLLAKTQQRMQTRLLQLRAYALAALLHILFTEMNRHSFPVSAKPDQLP